MCYEDIKKMKNLISLKLIGCARITKLSNFAHIPYLTFKWCHLLNDLNALSSQNQSVVIIECEKINELLDIPGLKGVAVTILC
jgi:hypothetical protein